MKKMNKRAILTTAITLTLATTTGGLMTGCAIEELASIKTGHQGTDNILSGMAATSKAIDAAQAITPEKEYYIGRAVAADILQRYGLYEDDAATRYLNLLGQSIAMTSDHAPFAGYRFAILDTSQANAFAAPGAYIFVTRGLLRTVSSEEELAAALAHEIGHIEARHAIGAIKSQRWTEATRAMGDEAARQAGGDAARLNNAFGDAVGDVTQMLILTGYSREQEKAADQAAVKLLARANYNPGAMAAMLSKLDRHDAGLASLTQSHPGIDERIAALGASPSNVTVVANEDARQARFEQALANVRK